MNLEVEEKNEYDNSKITEEEKNDFTDENERTDIMLAALGALSNLFIEENSSESCNDQESSSTAHVHSSSCTHDHDTPIRYHHKNIYMYFF